MRMLDCLKRWLPRSTQAGPAAPRRRGRRLHLEQLEDRAVPATFTAANVSELIGAINAANGTAESDTIALAAGAAFSLTAVNNTTHGATGLPTIAAGEDLTILGNGDTIERKTAGSTPAFRLFDVAVGATLTLRNLTLQGGLAYGYNTSAQGGAIYNQGDLTLDGVTLQGNKAQGADGISYWGSGLPGGSAAGGGVYSNGTLTVEGCTIANNSAAGGRGGDGYRYYWYEPGIGRLRSYGPGGDGGNAFGGGICIADGTATVRSSALTGNSAKGGAHGTGNQDYPVDDGQGIGGALYIAPAASLGLDSFTLTHVKRNSASTSGADLAGLYDAIV